MQPKQPDSTLDEIAEVISKLQGGLKDDRISENFRTSNVTNDPNLRSPLRVAQIPGSAQPTLVGNQNVFTHSNNPPQYGQRPIVSQHGPPHGYPGNQYYADSSSRGSVVQQHIGQIPPTTANRNSFQPEQLAEITKSLQHRLSQYQKFERSVLQKNRQVQLQVQQLIDVVNYQQSQIVSLETHNQRMQDKLSTALETQKIYEEELKMYKLKLLGLERTVASRELDNKRSSLDLLDNSSNDIFRQMMKSVTKTRVGSPGKSVGLTLSAVKR